MRNQNRRARPHSTIRSARAAHEKRTITNDKYWDWPTPYPKARRHVISRRPSRWALLCMNSQPAPAKKKPRAGRAGRGAKPRAVSLGGQNPRRATSVTLPLREPRANRQKCGAAPFPLRARRHPPAIGGSANERAVQAGKSDWSRVRSRAYHQTQAGNRETPESIRDGPRRKNRPIDVILRATGKSLDNAIGRIYKRRRLNVG